VTAGEELENVMQTLLLVAELIIAVALICFVLLQRSEGGGLGMGGGGGSMGGLFTARGAADTLTRTTAILAFLFFVTCIVLNILALRGRDQTSILDVAPTPTKSAPAPLPVGPSVPKPQ
jgi:preprotein translocase subunit SecG